MKGNSLRYMAAACAALLATPAPAATVVTVDSGSVGRSPSIAIGADGLPIMTYLDGGNGALRFAKCTTLDCSSAILETIGNATGNARGDYSSLQVSANGRPIVAWYDSIDDNLVYARCPNPDCSGDDVLRTLDGSPEDTGRDVSMVVDANGLPRIAYVNTTQHSLQFAGCEVPACLDVAITEVDDDPVNSVGTDTQMVLGNDGLPVIVYLDVTADAVLVAKCIDAACSPGAQISVLDAQVPTTIGVSPAIVIGTDGNPVISYFDEDILALEVAHCNDPACVTPATITRVDDVPGFDAGRYSSIALRPDGRPVISYQFRDLGGAGGSGLRIAECTTADCTGDANIIDIDFRPGEISGVSSDIVIGSDGGAIVSYYDTTTTSLKVAKCNVQGCEGPGDRIFADGFE